MGPGSKAVFCDFDGTVAARDIGYNLFHHFSQGRNDALLPDWKAGRISTREILSREAEMVTADREEIERFAAGFELDPTFVPFVASCRSHNLPVIILSEGMDLYIRPLLSRSGLDDLIVHSNRAVFDNGRLRIEFPFDERVCQGCGNCKAARMREYRKKIGGNGRLAFVGDGYSDACAAQEADLVFAKKDLVRYCEDEGISYNAFRDFDDVASQMLRQGFLGS